jgi:hypothetical protein
MQNNLLHRISRLEQAPNNRELRVLLQMDEETEDQCLQRHGVPTARNSLGRSQVLLINSTDIAI